MPVVVNRRRKRAVSNEEELDKELRIYHQQTELCAGSEDSSRDTPTTNSRDSETFLYHLREGLYSFLKKVQNVVCSVQRLTESLSSRTEEMRHEITNWLQQSHLRPAGARESGAVQGNPSQEGKGLKDQPNFNEDYFLSLRTAEESLTIEDENASNKNQECFIRERLVQKLLDFQPETPGTSVPWTVAAQWIIPVRFLLTNLMFKTVKAIQSAFRIFEQNRFSESQTKKIDCGLLVEIPDPTTGQR